MQQQIHIFSAAELIVAPHGAGLTNVTISPPGVRVLEMFPSSYVHRGLWAICHAIGGHYRYLVADMPKKPHRSNAGIADDLVVTVSAVERHVTGIFSKLDLRTDPEGHRRVLAVLEYLKH